MRETECTHLGGIGDMGACTEIGKGSVAIERDLLPGGNTSDNIELEPAR